MRHCHLVRMAGLVDRNAAQASEARPVIPLLRIACEDPSGYSAPSNSAYSVRGGWRAGALGGGLVLPRAFEHASRR
jgi:hypothetical protein